MSVERRSHMWPAVIASDRIDEIGVAPELPICLFVALSLHFYIILKPSIH